MAASAQDDDDQAIRDAVVQLVDDIDDVHKKEGRIYVAHVIPEDTVLDFRRDLGLHAIIVHASCVQEAYVVIADNVVKATRDSESPVKYKDFFTDNPTWLTLYHRFRRLKYDFIELDAVNNNHIYKIDDGRTIKAACKRE